MKPIHVVCKRPTAARILPEMARLLRDGNGWTLSDTTELDAINYYIAYSDMPDEFPSGSAAYFSHRDDACPEKAAKWDKMAAKVALRITTARKYLTQLEQYGPTVYVSPPLNHSLFRPVAVRGVRADDAPIVGVGGFTYGDGRKGEDMIAEAVKALPGVAWRASGRGWPVADLRGYSLGQLPEFYSGLDVFLCASRIEGIPMTVLEAMACGVRVVVPRGVGILDELPDMPDVVRFDAGNTASMIAALKIATRKTPTDRKAVMAAVEKYTAGGWVNDTRKAFEQWL